jgi:signal recognition particle receptor subunit beta
MALNKLAASNDLVLKENQKDAALRIMQYFVKVNNKVPHRYHNYIALNVVDLHSFYSPSKITDLGAVALGLVGLAESYKEADVEARFGKIMRAISIVDEDSAAHIQQFYL